MNVLGSVHWPAKRLGSHREEKGKVSEERPHLNDLRAWVSGLPLLLHLQVPFKPRNELPLVLLGKDTPRE